VSASTTVAGQAVLYPLLSRAMFTGIVVLSLLVIAAAALLLPASLESCQRSCEPWRQVFEMARVFPGIRGMAGDSGFPLAAAISHFSVMVLGTIGGVCLVLTRFDKVNVSAGVNAGGWRGRILRLGFVALLSAQFFIAPPEMYEQQRTYGFFQTVSRDRATFLVWMGGIYLGTVAVMLCLAAELSGFISRRRTWLR
jgi:hypothetical protein